RSHAAEPVGQFGGEQLSGELFEFLEQARGLVGCGRREEITGSAGGNGAQQTQRIPEGAGVDFMLEPVGRLLPPPVRLDGRAAAGAVHFVGWKAEDLRAL